MRQFSKKQLLAVMFMKIFVSMVIGAQLARTSNAHLRGGGGVRKLSGYLSKYIKYC